MTSALISFEEELDYAPPVRLRKEPLREQLGLAAVRQTNGSQRRATEARYQRRTRPTRRSGMERRGGSRCGM